MKITKRINSQNAKNVIWTLIGTFGTQAVNLILAYILLKKLNHHDYGFYIWIYTGYLAITGIITSSLLLGSTKFSSENKMNLSSVIKELTTTGIIGMLILTILTLLTFLLFLYFKNTELKPEQLELIAILSILSLLSFYLDIKKSIYAGLLNGLGKFKLSSILRIAESLINLAFIVVGAIIYGTMGAIIGFIISSIVKFLLYLNTLNKKILIKKSNGSSLNSKKAKEFILHSSLSGIFVTPALWIGTTKLLEAGPQYVASYNILNQWKSAALVLSNAINTVALPKISATQNKKSYHNNHLKLITLNVFFSLITGFFLYLASKAILNIYDLESIQNLQSLNMLIIANIVITYSNTLGVIFTSKGEARINLIMNFIWFIMFITLITFLKIDNVLDFSKIMLYSYLLHVILLHLTYIKWKRNAH